MVSRNITTKAVSTQARAETGRNAKVGALTLPHVVSHGTGWAAAGETTRSGVTKATTKTLVIVPLVEAIHLAAHVALNIQSFGFQASIMAALHVTSRVSLKDSLTPWSYKSSCLGQSNWCWTMQINFYWLVGFTSSRSGQRYIILIEFPFSQ